MFQGAIVTRIILQMDLAHERSEVVRSQRNTHDLPGNVLDGLSHGLWRDARDAVAGEEVAVQVAGQVLAGTGVSKFPSWRGW